MRFNRDRFTLIMSIAIVTAAMGLGRTASSEAATLTGESQKLGGGSAHFYADLKEDGSPTAIGIAFDEASLEGLPKTRNTTGRCFDLNGDGKFNHDECEGDHETKLGPPHQLAGRRDIPFKWIGVNWNTEGHPPMKVYGLPHFDFHFYMVRKEEIGGIRTGRCGFFMNCDDFKRATKPVPPKYVPCLSGCNPHPLYVGCAVIRQARVSEWKLMF